MVSTFRSQVTFAGTADCDEFEPNRLNPAICVSCMKNIFAHTEESCCPSSDPDLLLLEERIQRALECSQKGQKTPSLIFTVGDENSHLEVLSEVLSEQNPCSSQTSQSSQLRHSLYLGGYVSVCNVDFIRSHNIRHILSTAKGLEMFGPKYTNAVEKLKILNFGAQEPGGAEEAEEAGGKRIQGVTFKKLDWMDDLEQDLLKENKLAAGVRFLMRALFPSSSSCNDDSSVLVHCAQGKSRSAAVVVAFLSVVFQCSIQEALNKVQERRKTAGPNENFMKQLKNWRESDNYRELLEEYRVILEDKKNTSSCK